MAEFGERGLGAEGGAGGLGARRIEMPADEVGGEHFGAADVEQMARIAQGSRPIAGLLLEALPQAEFKDIRVKLFNFLKYSRSDTDVEAYSKELSEHPRFEEAGQRLADFSFTNNRVRDLAGLHMLNAMAQLPGKKAALENNEYNGFNHQHVIRYSSILSSALDLGRVFGWGKEGGEHKAELDEFEKIRRFNENFFKYDEEGVAGMQEIGIFLAEPGIADWAKGLQGGRPLGQVHFGALPAGEARLKEEEDDAGGGAFEMGRDPAVAAAAASVAVPHAAPAEAVDVVDTAGDPTWIRFRGLVARGNVAKWAVDDANSGDLARRLIDLCYGTMEPGEMQTNMRHYAKREALMKQKDVNLDHVGDFLNDLEMEDPATFEVFSNRLRAMCLDPNILLRAINDPADGIPEGDERRGLASARLIDAITAFMGLPGWREYGKEPGRIDVEDPGVAFTGRAVGGAGGAGPAAVVLGRGDIAFKSLWVTSDRWLLDDNIGNVAQRLIRACTANLSIAEAGDFRRSGGANHVFDNLSNPTPEQVSTFLQSADFAPFRDRLRTMCLDRSLLYAESRELIAGETRGQEEEVAALNGHLASAISLFNEALGWEHDAQPGSYVDPSNPGAFFDAGGGGAEEVKEAAAAEEEADGLWGRVVAWGRGVRETFTAADYDASDDEEDAIGGAGSSGGGSDEEASLAAALGISVEEMRRQHNAARSASDDE